MFVYICVCGAGNQPRHENEVTIMARLTMPCFYVCDENHNEIHGEKYGFVNDFTSFTKASAWAKKVSKIENGRFSVDVCVPCTMYEGGKIVED